MIDYDYKCLFLYYTFLSFPIITSTIGFINVINNNRDFYHDIQHNNIPDYDILITNPPYSCDHKLKLLNFLKNNYTHQVDHHHHQYQLQKQQQHHYSHHDNRPFALLLPAYIATKSYWKDFLSSFNNYNNDDINNHKINNNNYNNSNNNNGNNNNVNKCRFPSNLSYTTIPTSVTSTNMLKQNNQKNSIMNIMYLLPPDYYHYSHPEGTGKDIPPFYSIWFIGMIDKYDNNDKHDYNVDNAYGYNNNSNIRYL